MEAPAKYELELHPAGFRRTLSRKLSKKVGDDSSRKPRRTRILHPAPGMAETAGGSLRHVRSCEGRPEVPLERAKNVKGRKSRVLRPLADEGKAPLRRASSVVPDREEVDSVGVPSKIAKQVSGEVDKKPRKSKNLRPQKNVDSKPDTKPGGLKAEPHLDNRGLGGRARSITAGLTRTLTKERQGDLRLARTKTGAMTASVKERVLVQYADLALEQFSSDNHGRNLVLQGVNSIRAEVLDLATMAQVMDDNRKVLTHSALDRFFDWLPLFGVYLERYFFVEEDILMQWIIEKEGPLRGKIKAGSRMKTRGTILKLWHDLNDLQDLFPRSLPAGERIGKVISAVETFAEVASEYIATLLAELPKLINKHYDRQQCDKLRCRWVRHVAEHVGTEDFLVLYTRWMTVRDLREWKAKILLRTEFKYMTYSGWERDMDHAHFRIVRDFAELLHQETQDENDFDPVKHRELMRLKSAARQQELCGGNDGECDEEGQFEDYDEEVVVEEFTGDGILSFVEDDRGAGLR